MHSCVNALSSYCFSVNCTSCSDVFIQLLQASASVPAKSAAAHTGCSTSCSRCSHMLSALQVCTTVAASVGKLLTTSCCACASLSFSMASVMRLLAHTL